MHATPRTQTPHRRSEIHKTHPHPGTQRSNQLSVTIEISKRSGAAPTGHPRSGDAEPPHRPAGTAPYSCRMTTKIRPVICATNAIESLNARYRRAVRARVHFPTEQAARKCLYRVTRSLDPTRTSRARWTMRWKPSLNAFANTFHDPWPNAESY